MSTAVWVPLIMFVLIFILRIPISLGMLSAAILYLLVKGANIGQIVNLVMFRLYSNYTVIAVPLFVFSALVMNTGKITEKVFNFADALVGRWKGGLGHVNVLASLIFSGMTGSAVADASGLGIMEIDAMRKAGYDDGFSCAVTASSAVIGPTFPPSIPMLIYAMLSGASVGALFLGGVAPGVLLAVVLMVYVAYISNKRNYPRGPQYTLREFLVITFKALPALFTPVILLTCIYTGVVTPTEAAAVAALYALVVSIFVYKSMGLKELFNVLKETVKTTGNLGLIVGSAFAFSYIAANERIPQTFASFFLGITDNKYVFLFIINIAFLILGMFFDTSTIQLVFLPIVLPVVNALGIDLVHFGVVICLNMMIGLLTPPFGMLLFITSGISGTPLKDVIKETLPMTVVMIIFLFILTFVPDIVMFIPNHMMAR
ncbi:TRAP transporter large permease [Caldicoprobacter algeriensis]|uniref:TRAP transporter large permease n=1 Tax=Caldicoprobacter algeriensis TaxID=699281 RepID=UPI0020795FB8|nr:TRAP transporter large permease [Caldicoprobacter algeriensis]MCM8900197.1 TRAP transporter large permease [Caldicoprobacter algeriensis]